MLEAKAWWMKESQKWSLCFEKRRKVGREGGDRGLEEQEGGVGLG